LDKIDQVVQQWGTEKPHLDTVPMALIGRLLRISKHLESSTIECHKGFGLTLGEFDVLATLRRATNNSSLTPSELLSSLLLSSGAMTNRLDNLQSKQLIIRQGNKKDKRSVLVVLTPKGRLLIDEVIEVHVKVQQSLVFSLDEQEKVLLNRVLKNWLAGFESNK
jgi:DNA-binding MarR family transcriptional regulator